MNIQKLKAKIVERGMNVETLGKNIGVDRSSMYRMLNNPQKITIGRALAIKKELNMTTAEAAEIFLGQ